MDAGSFGMYACIFVALYFEVFLLIAFLEKRPQASERKRPTRFPSVCIIVPCWNEGKTLGHTLESLLALDYPREQLSILVVNDGSTDDTEVIAREYAARHPQIDYVYKENGGKYTALNYGITHTTAEIIGCLDADSFVAPYSLVEMMRKFEDEPQTMALTPAMKVYEPRTILERMQSVEYTFGIFYKKMFDNIAAISVLPGPFSMYRREVFGIVGLFRHAHQTEDMEIAFRMHKHHLRIANAHTAHVYTKVPTTVRTLVKQRTRWSQGYLQNSIDYRHMYFNPAYGNFGMLALPFGLFAFLAGLYTALYTVFTLVSNLSQRALSLWYTGVPLRVPQIHTEWFYLNTGMLTFLMAFSLIMALTAILLGQRIAKNQLPIRSIVYCFTLFGFVATLWLVRAAWGTLRSREASWR